MQNKKLADIGVFGGSGFYKFLDNIEGGIGVKLVKCDEVGNPYKMIDAAKNRYDVYEKAADGSTTLKTKNKFFEFPNLIFNKVCENIFNAR